MDNFIYRNEARKKSTTVIVALVIAAICAMWVIFDAHWLIVVPLLACIAALLIDWIRNPRYLFEITSNNISWTIGDALTNVPLADLSHVAIATRLDRSAVATFYRHDGQKLRLHPACTPPQPVILKQLNDRGIKVSEKQFSFLN